MRCLGWKIMNFQDFLFAVNYIGSKTVSVISWILQTSEIKPIKENFEGVNFWDRFILIDLFITHIHFGSSQPPFSLKITTIASLTRKILAITPTNLLRKDLIYSANTLRPILCGFFVLIQIFVLNRAPERTQHANSGWQQQSYFTRFLDNLILYIFKLVLYFDSTVFSNQIKHYGIRGN